MNNLQGRHRRALVAMAVITAFAGIAAGCGDDGGSSTATTAGSGTTATGAATTAGAAAAKPTGEPIKLGLAVALTGPSASSYKSSPDVAKAWVEWVNTEKGGIGGRPVEVVVEDTAGQAASAQAAGKKLVEESKVVAVIINDTTSETALKDYTAEKAIPVIGGSSNAAAVWLGTPNYFMIGATNPIVAASGMVAAQANGANNFGAAVCAEVPACAESSKLYGAVAPQVPAGAIAFGGVVTIAATAPNYTAECLKLNDDKLDYVQLSVASATALRVVADCQKQGYTGKFGVSAASVQASSLETISSEVGGSMSAFPWWSDAAPVKQYRTVMDTYAKGKEYRDHAGSNVWVALELFRKTLGAGTVAATTTPADVMKAYHTIKNETLDGLLPQPITFTEGAPSPAITCFWTFNMKGGKFTTLSSGTPGNGVTGDLASTCFAPKLG